MFLNCQKPSLIKDPYVYKPDSIMLDLEDAVAEREKDAARYSLYHALQEIDYRGVERVVRINGLDTNQDALLPEAAIPSASLRLRLLMMCAQSSTPSQKPRESSTDRREACSSWQPSSLQEVSSTP